MLATVGVNPALIAIILGVDRILDMCRTTLNVVGDLTAATYVARSEGFPLLDGSPQRRRERRGRQANGLFLIRFSAISAPLR